MAVRLPSGAPYDFAVLQANVDSLVASSRRADVQCALFAFCQQGDTAAATWLVDRFALTVDDARAGDNFALQLACRYGHLAAAMWLADRFGLTAADALANNNFALEWACSDNYPAIMHFIVAPRPNGLGATPPQALARELFLAETRRGFQELTQVLFEHAGLDNLWLAAHAAPQR
jgi:hypothetical protein